MKLTYEDHDTISVLKVEGEMTADHTDAFRRTCIERIEAGIRDIVLDVQAMSLIDSAGLELLLWLMEELGQRKGQIRLVNPDETVSKILHLTRLDRRLDVHQTIESAAKSLR